MQGHRLARHDGCRCALFAKVFGTRTHFHLLGLQLQVAIDVGRGELLRRRHCVRQQGTKDSTTRLAHSPPKRSLDSSDTGCDGLERTMHRGEGNGKGVRIRRLEPRTVHAQLRLQLNNVRVEHSVSPLYVFLQHFGRPLDGSTA